MVAVLPVKKGLSSPTVTSIPEAWNRQWFRYFIDNFLTNADIRNVVPGSGITISGNVSGNSTSVTPGTTVTISQSPVPNNTVMGNISGSTAVPVALNQAQLTSLVNIFTSALSGSVPASGGGTTNFLRADGQFVPPVLGAIPNNTVIGNVSGGVAAPIAITQAQLTALINVFTSTLSGAVPASGGGTTNFLRADGIFAIPPSVSGANPTAAVGLSAINGIAPTFLRSDGAPALSQAISPVWTGNHTHTPSAGVAVIINGTVGNSALTVNGATSTSTSITVVSGNSASTASGDVIIQRNGSTINSFSQGPSLKIEDTSGSDFSTTIQSSGGQTEIWSGLGAAQNQIIKILTSRGIVINAAASGNSLAVTSATAGQAGLFTTNVAAGSGYGLEALGSSGAARDIFQVAQQSFSNGLQIQFDNTQMKYTFADGNVLMKAPVSGDTLTVAPSTTGGFLIATNAALTNNAGATSPTLGATGPTGATTPTKWIKINDNGTTRSIPAW